MNTRTQKPGSSEIAALVNAAGCKLKLLAALFEGSHEMALDRDSYFGVALILRDLQRDLEAVEMGIV